MKLNQNQQQAVDTHDGYVRIIAGAGSGKTRVLVERIASIIERGEAYPNQILAITFTNKAAAELKERLKTRFDDESGNFVVATTFHSLCVRILREKEALLNLQNPFLILDPDDQKTLLKRLIDEVFGKKSDVKPALAISKISQYKNSNMTPTEAEVHALTQFEKDFIEVYRRYQSYLRTQSLFDFDDLLLETVKLFEQNPEMMENVTRRYRYIHVDEFQDTNEVQSILLHYLVSGHHNLCVVGDPDQSIYSWRGARPKILLDFDKQYASTQTIYLSENYRSTQHILDRANRLIANNKSRLDNPLNAQIKGDMEPVYTFVDRENDEIKQIVSQINTLISEGREYHDMAILYRANYVSRYIETGLIQAGIPYQIFGSVQFYQRLEVKHVMALLKLHLSQDDLSFARIISHLTSGIGPKAMQNITLAAQSANTSMWQAFCTMTLTPKQSIERDRLVRALSDISEIDVIDEPQRYFQTLIDKVNLYAYLDDEDGSRKENIMELERVFCDFFSEREDATLADFLTEAALYSDNDKETVGGSVTLMTVHAAKGLEFPIVFLASFVEGVFPSQKTLDESLDGLEEERRLAYVAITRAKSHLYMSGARVGGYHYDFRMPSQFVDEMDVEVVRNDPYARPKQYTFDSPKASMNATFSQPKQAAYTSNETYSLGDSVIHTLFGKGTIVGTDGDLYRIAFDGKGIKVLKLPHQTVKKA